MSNTLQGNGNHFQGESGGSTSKLILVIGKCNRGPDIIWGKKSGYVNKRCILLVGRACQKQHVRMY